REVGAAPHRGNANRPLAKQGKANAIRTRTKSVEQALDQGKAKALRTPTKSAAQAKNRPQA
ncbi:MULTISPECIES: hypothetical protein, partial [Paraburkholderia]